MFRNVNSDKEVGILSADNQISLESLSTESLTDSDDHMGSFIIKNLIQLDYDSTTLDSIDQIASMTIKKTTDRKIIGFPHVISRQTDIGNIQYLTNDTTDSDEIKINNEDYTGYISE